MLFYWNLLYVMIDFVVFDYACALSFVVVI